MSNDHIHHKPVSEQLADHIQEIIDAAVEFQNKFAHFEQEVNHHPRFHHLLEDPLIHQYWKELMEANLKFVRLGNDDSWKKLLSNLD